MAVSIWFMCTNCPHGEQKMLPDHVKTAPCPECGETMVRK
jgi:predicted RNA-binding Zn-ribbon protein involved in translation (DUF1610 family)